MNTRFEWDDQKATSNYTKHGISSNEASTVFENPLAALFDDAAHSDDEVRELIIGHSTEGRVLIVAFTERAEGVVRIISARLATKREQHDYEENINFS